MTGLDTRGLSKHAIPFGLDLRSGLGTTVVYYFALTDGGIRVEDFGKLSHLSMRISWLCTYAA
jgi:hypothetical protein